MLNIVRIPIKVLVVLVCLCPLLAGCWDRIEIEERAVILGIAVDQVQEEDKAKEEAEEEQTSHLKGKFPSPEKELIRITAQIAVPGRIPLGPGEGGGGGGGGAGQQTVWALDVVGHTVDDAISNLQQKISGPLFFGHLRIIVVSEEVARKGLENLNDYFRRNPEIRRMSWMAVSKGEAAELMKAAPELERVPTLYLMSTLEQAVRMGKFPEIFVGEFWSHLSKKGQEGYLPYVEIKEKDNVLLSGMAYFIGDRMAGSTTPIEIGFYMAILGLNPAGYQVFAEIPEHPGHLVMFQATHRKSLIKLQMENGRPRFQVLVFVEGNIREKTDEQVILKNDQLKKIEQELNRNAEAGLQSLIQQTQVQGSDIFGFGEYVRAKKSRYWNKEIQTNDNWIEVYKDLPVEVSVQCSVRRTGMKAR